jgi:hypothetical protein
MFQDLMGKIAKAEADRLEEANRAALNGDSSKLRAYNWRAFIILCVILLIAAIGVILTIKDPSFFSQP